MKFSDEINNVTKTHTKNPSIILLSPPFFIGLFLGMHNLSVLLEGLNFSFASALFEDFVLGLEFSFELALVAAFQTSCFLCPLGVPCNSGDGSFNHNTSW